MVLLSLHGLAVGEIAALLECYPSTVRRGSQHCSFGMMKTAIWLGRSASVRPLPDEGGVVLDLGGLGTTPFAGSGAAADGSAWRAALPPPSRQRFRRAAWSRGAPERPPDRHQTLRNLHGILGRRVRRHLVMLFTGGLGCRGRPPSGPEVASGRIGECGSARR